MSLAKAVTQQDVLDADSRFYQSNFGKGFVRSTAAVLVKYLNPIMSRKQQQQTKKTNLRGSSKPQRQTTSKKGSSHPPTMRTDVPAAYGFTVRSSTPKVVRTGTGAHIIGSDYAGNVLSFNSSNYEPAATVPLNPSYYTGAMLGSLSRAFEKYRFKRAVIEYIPSVPTSTQGQLVMLSDRSVKNPFLDGSAASFLARALSQANAVACPLWQRTTFVCETASEWSLVDPLIDGDLDDTISLEVQLYSFGTTTQTSGILMLHYEIEFKDPLYTFHSTVIPIPVGIGSAITAADDTAVNAVSDTLRLTASSPTISGLGRGSILRLIFQQAGSTLPTGPATWSTVASTTVNTPLTTSTYSIQADALTIVPGMVFYALVTSGQTFAMYTSYEAAQAQATAGQVCYQTATTAAGTWKFIGQAVRIGTQLLMGTN